MLLAVDQRSISAALLSLLLLLLQITQLTVAYSKVSDNSLKSLRRPTDAEFDIHSGRILAPILIPRVPGTENSTLVLEHFNQYFHDNLPDWTIELHRSTSTTPTSNGAEIPFVNFVAYRDPPWASPADTGRLTLVAHYDSKYEPLGFIGAIDSAAPCAMILHAVDSIDTALTAKWSAMQASGIDSSLEEQIGIQVLFLDGEEAFKSWTGTDSLYGARAIAQTWEQTPIPPAGPSTYKNKLEQISLFMLLDLLGSKSPSIPTYFKTTHWAYQNLATLEERLRALGSFESVPGTWLPDSGRDAHASDVSFPSWGMQDDHIPFMARGVQVLHLIPARFPNVWHTIDDDGEHLDMPTVEDWAVLTAAFAAEWMELEGYMDAGKTVKKRGWEDVVISKTEL